MENIIITAAIQGAELTRHDTPYLPVSPEELAQEAKRAWNEGAAVIHLHVRDREGRPSQKARDYQENMEAIRASGCQAILQVSTGGALGMKPDERVEPLTLRPEYATLNTGSINFGRDIFINSSYMMEELARAMMTYGVKPEFEIYEEGHIHNALTLYRSGLVREPLNFDFVLGVPGAMAPTPRNLLHLVETLPPGANWGVAGIGRNELILGGMAVFIGGNVRVGLEDNIYYSKGILAKSTGELVARIARIAREAGREVATEKEARKILGIRKK